MMEIVAKLPDFEKRSFFVGKIIVHKDQIYDIIELSDTERAKLVEDDLSYVLPGFVDAHIHIESSMLIPSRFAEMAVRHGTVATVSDPHEIANVLGKDGVKYMIRNGETVPLKFGFTAPSCVPATDFETSGAILKAKELEELFKEEELVALGEMMNFPGVIFDDEEVVKKIDLAKRMGMPIDGHAPGLKGEQLKKYFDAGITTDHEAVTIGEAEEKINMGMKILIREGSAARNFEELCVLIEKYPEEVMLCSDDLHPDDLRNGHINSLVKRALAKGIGIFNLMMAASQNPIDHYNLNVGKLRIGDKADFIVVKDLREMDVIETYIDGKCVYSKGDVFFESHEKNEPNNIIRESFKAEDFCFNGTEGKYRVIVAQDGSLITKKEEVLLKEKNGIIETDISRDILKIAVVNRYEKQKPSIAWIKNFGLKEGAIASSVAHDSHNIVAVGVDDISLTRAVNELINAGGGIVTVRGDDVKLITLAVAGLMSTARLDEVADGYEALSDEAKEMGCGLGAPFMTLSFMSLLVIPELKLGDRGLFDVNQFKFTEVKI